MELRYFLDGIYRDEFTNFVLTPELKFAQPIPDIEIEKDDCLVGVCGDDVRGWSVERVQRRIQQQKGFAPHRFDPGPWYSMGEIEVTDFSLTYIKNTSVRQAAADNLFDRKKVNCNLDFTPVSIKDLIF